MKKSRFLSFFSILLIIFTINLSLVSCSNLLSDLSDYDINKDINSNGSDIIQSTGTSPSSPNFSVDYDDLFDGYTLIEVDGGNLSGHREPNVVVDIGFGDREYYAFTNEYGQLVKVIAEEIILQNHDTEPVNSKGRYYHDEAKVPGVESPTLDEGHVIADSLGGVANAYNITPQDSKVNRYGEQSDIEDAIRDANGCTNFIAIINYNSVNTQIPSNYSISYTIDGQVFEHNFFNYSDDPNEHYSNDESTSTSDTSSSDIVYWTEGGKSYHLYDDCSTLSRSTNILDGLISESGKYDPCNICY